MAKVKKTILLGVGLCAALSSNIQAYNDELFATRGFYGSIQYIYLNNYFELNNLSNESYLQLYQMGYEGFLYSPRLIKYDISGALYFDRTKSSSDKRDVNTNDQSFKLYLNLIQGSSYPFTLYIEKQSLPTISLTSNYIYIAQDTYRYGLYGSMKFNDYFIDYSARYRDTKSESSFTGQEIKGSSYTFSLSKRVNKHYYALYLRNINTNYYRKDFINNETSIRKNQTNDARINYNYRHSKTFRMNSYVQFTDTKYYNMKRLTTNVTFDWTPDDVYSMYFGLIGEKLKSQSVSSRYTTLFINGNYKITPKFTTTHNAQLYNVTSDNLKQNIGSLNLGLRYNDKLTETISYYTSANAGIKVERGSDAGDAGALLDRNVNTIDLSIGSSKIFLESGNTVGLSAYYSYFVTDLGEDNTRYTLSSSFTSRIRSNLRYNVSATYVKSKAIRVLNQEILTRKSEMFTVVNTLNYNTSIGINGKFTATTGVTYTYTNLGNSTGFRPYVNMTLFYRLRRNLIFSSMANISKDLYNDVTNYTSFAGLEYGIRKIRLSAGVRYTDQISEDRKGQQRKNIYLKFQRVF